MDLDVDLDMDMDRMKAYSSNCSRPHSSPPHIFGTAPQLVYYNRGIRVLWRSR